MNIMPFLMDFTETFSDMVDYENEYDDDFGFLVYPHEFNRRAHRPTRMQMYSARRLPYNMGGVKNLSSAATTAITKSKIDGDKTGTSSTLYSTVGKNGFQVCMNVQQFKPNELTVKTVDNTIIVEGKHEEREDDNGLISRQFTRKYNLPKGFDPKEVISTLSSDGILTIKSPLPAKLQDSAERIVQIQNTGPAYLSVKDNPKATVSSNVTNNQTSNNMMKNLNKNSTTNMNSTGILNNNSNSSSTGTITTTNNNNNPVATNNTNQDVPTTIQKEKSDIIIKEKCENGEKSENDKIIEQNNETIED